LLGLWQKLFFESNWRDKKMESIIARLLQDFEQGKMTRRQLIQSLTIAAATASAIEAAPAPATAAEGYVAKATSINHVSYQVSDYKKVRDFYAGLFGMQVSRDDGMQCRLSFGDNILIVRNRTPAGKVDHIAYTIANWDTDKSVKPAVEAELKRRGLQIRTTEGSFHVQDPDGFEVQIGGKEQ
jgi:catechol 2,3-dioxygenase-like lactoylglutathione lyase family enzyme